MSQAVFGAAGLSEARAEGKSPSRYVTTRNKKSLRTPNRLEKVKYNPFLRRRTLHRESIALDTPQGPIRVKVGRLNGHILNIAPEYEDCRRVAVERGVPLKQVLAEVSFEFQKRNGAAK